MKKFLKKIYITRTKTKNYWLKIKGRKSKEENYWRSKINMIMEYQKRINLLDNTPNQPTKFKTKTGFMILIIFNEEINDFMKIVKSLEESGLLIKGVSETIENETKETKGMRLGTLGASL